MPSATVAAVVEVESCMSCVTLRCFCFKNYFLFGCGFVCICTWNCLLLTLSLSAILASDSSLLGSSLNLIDWLQVHVIVWMLFGLIAFVCLFLLFSLRTCHQTVASHCAHHGVATTATHFTTGKWIRRRSGPGTRGRRWPTFRCSHEAQVLWRHTSFPAHVCPESKSLRPQMEVPVAQIILAVPLMMMMMGVKSLRRNDLKAKYQSFFVAHQSVRLHNRSYCATSLRKKQQAVERVYTRKSFVDHSWEFFLIRLPICKTSSYIFFFCLFSPFFF